MSNTSCNYNAQDSNLICGYLFNEQTVGVNKVRVELRDLHICTKQPKMEFELDVNIWGFQCDSVE